MVAVAFDALLKGWHAGPGAFGLLELVLLAAALLARPAVWRDGRARVCFGLAALMALAMVVMPSALAWGLFWIFAGLGAMVPAAARFGDAWCWAQRLLLHALRSTVAPAIDLRRWLKVRRKSGKGQIRAALPQLVLPAVGSLVILGLFASANPIIAAWLADMSSLSPRADLVGRLVFGAVWFTFAWSLLRPRMALRLIGTFDGSGDLPMPGVTPNSVRLSLIIFNALFALQNAMDLAWLWGLAALPEGMTLAEYAHRGAYPLIVTALLAAGFVLVALRPGSQTAAMPLVRRLVVLWTAQNVLLVGNAALRTMDYIAAYSLTQMRIAALLWMALVALGLMLVLWRMLAGKSAAWLINANSAAALALLVGCSFVDLDAISARYNIAHARELGGDGAPLDICYLQSMGSSAMVAAAELEMRPAPEPIHLWARLLRENVQARVSDDLDQGKWALLDAWRLAQVRSILRKAALAPQTHDVLDCRTRDVHALRLALGLELPTDASVALTGEARP
ncbi:DUF4153 domain-containing protein [Novosphingobium rhizosphaerae]|uniref:DUF4153 domain-containing protein n=1 Tax=Novosphingobium rhizosphaerae TaxID=1551649 RepID=UPI003D816CF2